MARIPNPYKLVPPKSIKFVKVSNELDELAEKIEFQLMLIVEKYAREIERAAKQMIPVDQGAAKASIYVATHNFSEKDSAYSEAKAVAKNEESRWHHKGRNLRFAEDAEEEQNIKKLHAVICVGVIYGMWLELGEYTMRATNPGAQHPYLTPAVLQHEEGFLAACAKVFDQVKM